MKRSGKKIILCTVMSAILIVFICFFIYLKNVSDYKQSVSNITFEEIDISDIPNGVYTGECNVDFIYAKVEVTIQDGQIIDIVILEHKNERGEAAEAVIGKIITEQKVDVDAISGATNSSKVLKKAVENALQK